MTGFYRCPFCQTIITEGEERWLERENKFNIAVCAGCHEEKQND